MTFKTKEEFEVLFKQHYAWLVKVAARLTTDVHSAEDVVQETFIALWEKRETFSIEGDARAYLRMAVMNRALNHLRNSKKISAQEINDKHEELAANDIHIPDTALIGKDTEQKVAVVLGALPEGSRVVFSLSRFEEMSYKEIADKLNVSVKAVEKHMTIALKHIRKHLPIILLLKLFFGGW